MVIRFTGEKVGEIEVIAEPSRLHRLDLAILEQ